MGEVFAIADMATFPWIGCLDGGCKAAEVLQLAADFPVVTAWHECCWQRPAAAKGLEVTKF